MAESKRLLIIDDEPGICDVLRLGFTSEGFDVEIANTGIDHGLMKPTRR